MLHIKEKYFERLTITNQQQLEHFCHKHSNKSLNRLEITGNTRGYKSINFECLQSLGLNELRLGSPITQEQLEQICTLVELRVLWIEHCGKLDHIEPISKLVNLKRLLISTPMGWLSKYYALPDIGPIGALKSLEWLNLAGVKMLRDGLKPLQKLSNLKQVIVVSTYWRELPTIKLTNPNLKIDRDELKS